MASFADYVKDLMSVLPQVNGNPMLSVTSMTDDNARYREDPFYRSREIQARDQLVLDEEERRRREAALSGSGMMTGGDGANSGGENGGLTPEQIAFLDAEAAIPGARDARMGKINSLFSLVAQGLVPGLSSLSISQMGPEAYADMMQGHSRTVAGDITGYRGTDSRMPAREADKDAPVVSGAYVDAINQGLTPDQASNVEAGGGGYSGPGGVGGSGVSYGGGNAADGYGYGGW